MATIVCQGLQSCLESQVVESRTLRLKLSSPKPQFPQSLELALKPCICLDSNTKEIVHRHNQDGEKTTSLTPNPEMGGWSFLQVLESSNLSMEKKDNVYVHPLMKRYPSTLSEKSLELCTENLGCETGSDDILENLNFSSEVGNSPTREQQQQQKPKPRQFLSAKKANSCDFPPPLTTMTGSESLHFRPHREDGRLIIEAVKVPQTQSYFQVERSHGRLRLCFVKDSASNFDLENEQGTENDVADYDEPEEIEEEEEEDETEHEIEEEYEIEEEKDTDGNNLEVGGEIGKEEFQRPTRCKEGELENKGLRNWEPFWVATS